MDRHLNSQDSARSNIKIFSVLLLLALVFRLPWFFQDVINWDESVFILVGDAWAKGHLPYTLTWDNKPPLSFAFFALVATILPDSLAGIRLGGTVAVAVAGLILFQIAGRMMSRSSALLASALFVVAVSVLITDGMAVMTEHVALVPLLGALALVGRPRATPWSLICAGVLLGVATMVRTNLAYVLLAATVFVPILGGRQGIRQYAASATYIALGGLAVIFGIFVVYLLSGRGDLFINSVIRVALAYSQTGMGYATAANEVLHQALRLDSRESILDLRRAISTVFWSVGFVGLMMLLFARGRWTTQRSGLIVFCTAVFFSILMSGHVWSHYLIQIAPFFAVGLGFVASRIRPLQNGAAVGLIVLTLAIGFTFSRSHFYSDVWASYRHNGSPYRGETFEVAQYLQSVMQPGDTLFVTNDILLYWLTGTYPPIPVAAFPFNLWEEETILKPLYGPQMTTETAFQEIDAREPTWMVVPVAGSRSRIGGNPGRVVPEKLLQAYYINRTVSGRNIYKRR